MDLVIDRTPPLPSQHRRELLGLNWRLKPCVYYQGVCERCQRPWRSLIPYQRFCSRLCKKKANDHARWLAYRERWRAEEIARCRARTAELAAKGAEEHDKQ